MVGVGGWWGSRRGRVGVGRSTPGVVVPARVPRVVLPGVAAVGVPPLVAQVRGIGLGRGRGEGGEALATRFAGGGCCLGRVGCEVLRGWLAAGFSASSLHNCNANN